MVASDTHRLTVAAYTVDEPGWTAAVGFQHDQYVSFGWIAPHDERRVVAYEPWDDRAVFHVVEAEGECLGVLRTIPGAIEELPVGQAAQPMTSPCRGEVVEFASLVTSSTPAAHRCASLLYTAGFQWTVRRRAQGIVALVDAWLLAILRETYGLPFSAHGPSVRYLGTTPRPIGVSLADIARTTSLRKPRFYAQLVDGLSPADCSHLEQLARDPSL